MDSWDSRNFIGHHHVVPVHHAPVHCGCRLISIGSYQSTREVLWNPRPSAEGARARMNKVLPSTSVMEPIYPEQCALLAS